MVRKKENSEERPDDKKATSLPACEVVGLLLRKLYGPTRTNTK